MRSTGSVRAMSLKADRVLRQAQSNLAAAKNVQWQAKTAAAAAKEVVTSMDTLVEESWMRDFYMGKNAPFASKEAMVKAVEAAMNVMSLEEMEVTLTRRDGFSYIPTSSELIEAYNCFKQNIQKQKATQVRREANLSLIQAKNDTIIRKRIVGHREDLASAKGQAELANLYDEHKVGKVQSYEQLKQQEIKKFNALATINERRN